MNRSLAATPSASSSTESARSRRNSISRHRSHKEYYCPGFYRERTYVNCILQDENEIIHYPRVFNKPKHNTPPSDKNQQQKVTPSSVISRTLISVPHFKDAIRRVDRKLSLLKHPIKATGRAESVSKMPVKDPIEDKELMLERSPPKIRLKKSSVTDNSSSIAFDLTCDTRESSTKRKGKAKCVKEHHTDDNRNEGPEAEQGANSGKDTFELEESGSPPKKRRKTGSNEKQGTASGKSKRAIPRRTRKKSKSVIDLVNACTSSEDEKSPVNKKKKRKRSSASRSSPKESSKEEEVEEEEEEEEDDDEEDDDDFRPKKLHVHTKSKRQASSRKRKKVRRDR